MAVEAQMSAEVFAQNDQKGRRKDLSVRYSVNQRQSHTRT